MSTGVVTPRSQRSYDKKDVFNLNEDEELTHFGQSLSEMETFNDFVNSDDESEEKGLLSGKANGIALIDHKNLLINPIMILFPHPAEMTASHFGGGGGLLRKKTSGDQQEEGGSQRAKSRQELIEELILKSKQEKVRSNTELHASVPLLNEVPCPKVSVNNTYFIWAPFFVLSPV